MSSPTLLPEIANTTRLSNGWTTTVNGTGNEPTTAMTFDPGLGDPALNVYLSISGLWSLMILVGLVEIWRLRHCKAIVVRGCGLVCTAVVLIHLYLVFCVIEYSIKNESRCSARFWLVSLHLPAAITAFQASNARLVSYYQHNTTPNYGPIRKLTIHTLFTIWRHWKHLMVAQKAYAMLGIWLLLQFVTASIIFFSSRKFHAYGLWSQPSTNHEQCITGFEWIPSTVLYVVWAAGAAVFVIRYIREVKDIYKWALEIRLAIFVSIMGVPPWLLCMFLKTPTVQSIDATWPPPFWLIPGFMVMQGLLIGFPLWNIHNHALFSQTAYYGNDELMDDMQNMFRALGREPGPLIKYAASTRLNAELLNFLRDVKRWRDRWSSISTRWLPPNNANDRVSCYKHAALIYFKLVDERTAAFPVNISHTHRMTLEKVFESARYLGVANQARASLICNTVSPWDDLNGTTCASTPHEMISMRNSVIEAERDVQIVSPEAQQANESGLHDYTVDAINLSSPSREDAPESMTMEIFTNAYKEVSREAYYNIWLGYVEKEQKERSRAAATWRRWVDAVASRRP